MRARSVRPRPGRLCLRLEVEFRGKGRLDDRNLAAGIDHEIERTSLIDLHGNDNECLLNKPRGYTGDVSRAAGLGFDRGTVASARLSATSG
jgi:hypothetical protein